MIRPIKETKQDLRDSRKKWRRTSIVAIILLIFLPGLILTAKLVPPPCTEVKEIVITENFCLYTYAHLRNTTGSTEYFWAEYRENIDGPTGQTEATTSLNQVAMDVNSLYLNNKITRDQKHCLFAGIKGHEIKGK